MTDDDKRTPTEPESGSFGGLAIDFGGGGDTAGAAIGGAQQISFGAPTATATPVAPTTATGGPPKDSHGHGRTESKVVIIGSGPAGLTAAIYAARANLEPIVLAGSAPGGQLMITSDVENYPGFPLGIQGPELMAAFREQAERFGSHIVDVDVERVDFSERPFRIWARGVEYRGEAVIVATGASALWLGLESETRLRGRGVSACATCDGFFFRDKEIAVVGGGDTALEEATFLTRFASKVHLLHRRDAFRASKIMVDRAKAHPKIEIHTNTAVDEVLGSAKVSGLRLRDTTSGATREVPMEGLFVAIGYRPNTDVFREWLDVDDKGYLVVHDETGSKVDGVFIAGDVHDHRYRQAVTAAADGCKAAIDAERWLEAQGITEAATATAW
ncbi:MAG TPA: thioredoxin-disulfide reductase [Candidatus Limnocylindrales bacterium]|nr:thioredoxin-disulfide reductase [Candidatus Limnocylindrales bacterium]